MFLLDTSLKIVGLALRRLKFILNVMGLGGGQVQINMRLNAEVENHF